METISPGMRSPRFHALDVWRGLVCLLVVAEHAAVCLWGTDQGRGIDGYLRWSIARSLGLFLGAPLFFVMSGFCVASCIDSARRRGTSPTLFLARRLWRIYPPYWAALAGFVAVVSGLDAIGMERYHGPDVAFGLESPGMLDSWHWFGNITLTESLLPLARSGHEMVIYTRMAWSLCYQEQFYLVCFLTLVMVPARFWKAMSVVTAAVVGLRVVAYDAGALHRISGTFPELWHEFAVGLAVYWRVSRPTTRIVRRLLESGLAVLLVAALWTGFVSTAGAAAFGLLLIGLHRWDGPVAGLRALEPLRACGRRSYSIYLVHMPAVMIVNNGLRDLGVDGFWPRALLMIPAAVLVSVSVAWIFHAHIERHFLALPSLRRGWVGSPLRIPRLAAATSALAGVVRDARGALRPAIVRMPALAATVLIPVGLVTGAWSGTDHRLARVPRPAALLGAPMGKTAASLPRDERPVVSAGSIWGDGAIAPNVTIALNGDVVDRELHGTPLLDEFAPPRHRPGGWRRGGRSARFHRDRGHGRPSSPNPGAS